MEMESQIKALIAEKLPAQVGEVLKTRLEQAERDANTVKSQSEQIISKTATITGLEETIADYKQFDNRNSELTARENAVMEGERNLAIKKLEYELASEKDKTAFTKDVALGLVRNTTYRKHILDSENQIGYNGNNGNWIQPTPINKSFEESKSAE